MNKFLLANTLFFLYLFCFNANAENTDSSKQKETLIYKINIDSEINTTSHIILSNGLKEANKRNADAVLLHLNTYGGGLMEADSMRTAILYYNIPVYVFIDNNAASAGALISIACDKIFMRPGSSIGAATVVEGITGGEAPDKYQSYMRSIIRATAEAQGKDTIISGNDTTYKWKRDPLIAEAMVDDRISIPNLIDSGKTLTLTANEALIHGYCDGIVNSEKEIITDYLKCNEYKIEEYKSSFYDKLKGFLTSPGFQAILIMIIVAGIYFELQSPGIGFPSIAAITAAILYFTPLYLDGLAQHWEVIIFIIGIILVLLEIFVIPGFGIAGIGGIILIGMGLIFAMLNNDYFTFREVEIPDVSRSVLTVLSGMLLSFIAILWLSSRIGEKGMFRKIALKTDLESSSTVSTSEFNLLEKEGIAMTDLRPSGKIMVNGEVYDAISNNSFIERNTPIKVIKIENMQYRVERL
ncbi:membrane-bound serine protease (ClpP class) [Dysgonomonadaceae bacterium PH5-43]|nr:membrane-bound serine protease (ClpP class) [Dysgonomonadaceae bacterium PH5-43]